MWSVGHDVRKEFSAQYQGCGTLRIVDRKLLQQGAYRVLHVTSLILFTSCCVSFDRQAQCETRPHQSQEVPL